MKAFLMLSLVSVLCVGPVRAQAPLALPAFKLPAPPPKADVVPGQRFDLDAEFETWPTGRSYTLRPARGNWDLRGNKGSDGGWSFSGWIGNDHLDFRITAVNPGDAATAYDIKGFDVDLRLYPSNGGWYLDGEVTEGPDRRWRRSRVSARIRPWGRDWAARDFGLDVTTWRRLDRVQLRGSFDDRDYGPNAAVTVMTVMGLLGLEEGGIPAAP